MTHARRSFLVALVGLAVLVPAGRAFQEFTLEEAQTRIERLEARVAALEAAIAGEAELDGDEATYVVTGVLELTRSFNSFEDPAGDSGRTCAGFGSFEDLSTRAPVRVFNGSEETIGVGRIESVRVEGQRCVFSWSVEVSDAEFYEFQIGAHRSPVFSKADLEATDWVVSLEI